MSTTQSVKDAKGREVKINDSISFKKGANNYIKGVVEGFEQSNGKDYAIVRQLQKEGYGSKHRFDINDSNFYSMSKGQKYDLRELSDHFQQFPTQVYGKNFNTLIKNKDVLFALTRGYRTPLIKGFQSSKEKDGITEHYTYDAKIKVYGPSGNLKTKVDIAKPTLEEKPELFGRVFSKEDWKTLKKEGHLGLVDGFVNKKTGEEFSAYVSLDKDINDVVLLNEKALDLSKYYKTELSAKQQADLKKGKEITVTVDLGDKGSEKMKLRVDATKENLVRTDSAQKKSQTTKKEQAPKKGIKM